MMNNKNMLELDKYDTIKINGKTLLLTGVALSGGNQSEDAINNSRELVSRWNSHDRLTQEVDRLTAQNKALIEMLAEIADEAISYEKRTGKPVTWAYEARKLLSESQKVVSEIDSLDKFIAEREPE